MHHASIAAYKVIDQADRLRRIWVMAQERRFAELLSHVAREITQRQAVDVCCGDLTLEQFQTLRALGASDPLSIGVLSSRLRVDVSTMSRNVTVLERNGYLARARDGEDARVVRVRLTAKGKRALESLCCDEREVLQSVYDQLPAGERRKVIEALEVLRASVDASVAPASCCAPAASRKSTA